jgi:hypothetical protein
MEEGGEGGIRMKEGVGGGILRENVFLLWERAERGCEIYFDQAGTELLEDLGSEGQDIRRYPGARSFS